MTSRRIRAVAIALSLAIGSTAIAQAQTEQGQPKFPDIATPDVVEGTVEQQAVDALRSMSAYLMTLNTIGIVSQASLDAVTEDGQRIQMDGVVNYKVRKPNGFVIDYQSAAKPRRYIYDGKTFTVYSPNLGFYAQAPAPATNREVLDVLYKKYGLALPMEDLFRWGDNEERVKALKSAYGVGPALVDGVETNHFAFREENIDWEIWIQKGDQPVPRKLVIVDRTDPARPTFAARLQWTANPTFNDSDFAFVPDANAKKIQLATYKEGD